MVASMDAPNALILLAWVGLHRIRMVMLRQAIQDMDITNISCPQHRYFFFAHEGIRKLRICIRNLIRSNIMIMSCTFVQ